MSPEFSLRPSRRDDAEWMAELRAVVMRPDLERLGRFDPERIRARFLNGFVPANTWVVEVAAASVGLIAVRPEQDTQWIEHFYLAPEQQGHGLGAAVLETVLAGHRDERPFRLDVLRGSAARRLYRRHGFVFEHGDEVDEFWVEAAADPLSVVVADLQDTSIACEVSRLLGEYLRQTEAEKTEHGVGGGTPGSGLPERYEREVADPEGALSGSTVLIARGVRRVVGLVAVSMPDPGRPAEVKRLWVDPSARRGGVGTELLEAAIALVPTGRTIRLTVWQWRQPAIRSYRRLGFVEVPSWDRRPDLVCLERRPTPAGPLG